MMMIEFLRKVDIFCDMDGQDLSKVAAILKQKEFERGARVFSAGDPGGTVYLIRAGIIHITRDQPKAGAVVLARLSQGEVFGEMSYIDQRPRSANAVSAAKTTLLMVEREALDQLSVDLKLMNKILVGMLRKLSERLKKVDDQIEGFQDLIRYF